MDKVIYGVILAGGNGSRLWPLSREMYPKHLLKLNQENTLLQSTFLRLSKFINDENIITVTNIKHSSDVKSQLSELKEKLNSDEKYTVINEPIGRNTAPAIALSIFYILSQLKDKSIDPIILVVPSDHLIKNIDTSTKIFKKGIKLAEQGYIVTFGVTPNRPDTGYGYINTIHDDNISKIEKEAAKVKEFKEKPDFKTAVKYYESGAYYWNAGIFMFKASEMIEEFKKYCPEILKDIKSAKLNSKNTIIDLEDYEKIQNISIDNAIMEKSDKIVSLPFDCGWNDLGSWETIFDISEKDSDNNLILGNTINIDSKNSLIYSTSRLVAAIGIDNLAVVETDDAVLVCNKNKTQDVKQVYDILKHRNSPEYKIHTTVYRPWGFYTVLKKEEGVLVKMIHVNSKARLSVQMHNHRAEHWVVLTGTANVVRGSEEFILAPGESIDIPVKVKHSLKNLTDKDLEIIEIQKGELLSEDDIIRFEDIYGRA